MVGLELDLKPWTVDCGSDLKKLGQFTDVFAYWLLAGSL